MKLILITTQSDLEENNRIAEEARKLGYDFELQDLKKFEFGIIDGKIDTVNYSAEGGDIIIIRGVFNSIKAISAHIEGLRMKGVKVFDNNFLIHKYSINKLADMLKLAHARLNVPDLYHVHAFDNYPKYAERLGFPVILKLTRTGKGAGVYKLNSMEELKNFIERVDELGVEAKTYLIQKYIPYKFDLRILIIGSNVYTMRRIPKEGEFRANFSLGGSVELYDLDLEGEILARRALEAVGLKVGGVDMLIAADGKRYILEVNHTPGMLGMEKATGKNITRNYLDYAIAKAV